MRKLIITAILFGLVLSGSSPKAAGLETTLPLDSEGAHHGLAETRPEWPGMLDLENIHEGEILFWIGIYRETNEEFVLETLILSDPYNDAEGVCRFDMVLWSKEGPIGTTIDQAYCADYGLVMYQNELGPSGWNPTNHLIETGLPPLAQSEIESLKEALRAEPIPPPQTIYRHEDIT